MAAAGDPNNRAARNRAIRQEALREQIQADQLIRQTLARIDKLDHGSPQKGTEERKPLTANDIAAIKAANDASLRLLAKVLPDQKAVEVTGEGGGPVGVAMVDPSTLSTATLRELIAQRESLHEQPEDPG